MYAKRTNVAEMTAIAVCLLVHSWEHRLLTRAVRKYGTESHTHRTRHRQRSWVPSSD